MCGYYIGYIPIYVSQLGLILMHFCHTNINVWLQDAAPEATKVITENMDMHYIPV